MKSIGIIPARFGSTRFPGKPLVMINGKCMIQRVYEQAKSASKLSKVLVATDDTRIAEKVKSFGGNVVMTRVDHPNGTSRIVEALEKEQEIFDLIINIQGDEPFIQAEEIDALVISLESGHAEITTLRYPALDEEYNDPNVVKLVVDQNENALYFSRQQIPFFRDERVKTKLPIYKHLGIYGYTKAKLALIEQLPLGILAQAESLEQLSWLEAGWNIATVLANQDSISIDHPDDLKKINSFEG